MKKLIVIAFILVENMPVHGQQDYLGMYIDSGLHHNLALQQKMADYQASLHALEMAKSLFFPNISINARYTVAQGGRVIPVGDLVEPLTYNLNMLNLAVNGTMVDYSELTNQQFNFFRPREHETKLSLVQPIFNPDIYYNKQIKEKLVQAAGSGVDHYKRELVCEIKKAYFQYCQSIEILALLDSTSLLLDENLRASKSLYENDKVTIDHVYRSEAEIAKLDQKIAEAVMLEQASRAYFNFLLNRELEEQILTKENILEELQFKSLKEAEAVAINKRADIQMLTRYRQAAEKALDMKKAARLPTLIGAVDYGFQGEDYQFGKDHDFMLASLVFKWELFHGLKKQASIDAARVEKLKLEQQSKELENAVKMEVLKLWYALEASLKELIAAEKEQRAARMTYKIMEKKYKTGQVSLLEFIEARNNMTSAGQNMIIKNYSYYSNYAELEKAAALYEFKTNE